MAVFGNGGSDAGLKNYYDSFVRPLGVSEGEVYSGGVDKTDYEAKQKNIKSLNRKAYVMTKERGTTTDEYATGTNFSDTSGSIPSLIPLWLSPDIINISRKNTPLYEMLPKQAVRGKFYIWNYAQFASTNAEFKPEDASQPDYDDDYTTQSIEMKYCYAVGRVTGPMIVHSRGYINMERQQIMMRTRALIQKIENEIVDGDTSTDSNGFDGLGASITSNENDISDALSIAEIRTTVRYAKYGGTSQSDVLGGGNPDLIVTDLSTIDDIKTLLQSYLRYNTDTIAWGITTITFEGIPIIASKFMTDTSGSKTLYVLDTSVVRLGVALDITFERLGKSNDSNKFMIKWYGALLVLYEKFCAKATNIT